MIVTLPLSIEQLKQSISDESVRLEVDLANSKIKGKAALVYLSNLDLSGVSIVTDSLDLASKKELLIEYMNLKNILKLDQLLHSNLKVIFSKYEIDLGVDQETLNSLSILSDEEVKQLLADEQYMEVLGRLESILLALPYFVVTTANWFKKEYPNYMDDFEIINDVGYIGFTFVNYIRDPIFQTHFHAWVPQPQDVAPKYFKVHFDDYVYKGNSLGYYFAKDSIMLPLMEMITNGSLTPATLEEHQKELNDVPSN